MLEWGLGLDDNGEHLVVAYCLDGVVVINDYHKYAVG